MKSMWSKKLGKIPNKDISRDFVHLSQFMSYGNETVKDVLAPILEKCVGNEKYKDVAVKNLVGLAEDDERLMEDLSYFANTELPEFQKIKIIADEIIEKINASEKKIF